MGTPNPGDIEKLGAFYLGRVRDVDAGRPTDELVLVDSRDLTTHAVCVGMTGSGKTGLCISLIEEAARRMDEAYRKPAMSFFEYARRYKNDNTFTYDRKVNIRNGLRGFPDYDQLIATLLSAVYLAKGERDQADVLLRRQALLTGYEYNAFFGFTYTFGSIFNNVVNPRFF